MLFSLSRIFFPTGERKPPSQPLSLGLNVASSRSPPPKPDEACLPAPPPLDLALETLLALLHAHQSSELFHLLVFNQCHTPP